jgi:hypothetical protein
VNFRLIKSEIRKIKHTHKTTCEQEVQHIHWESDSQANNKTNVIFARKMLKSVSWLTQKLFRKLAKYLLNPDRILKIPPMFVFAELTCTAGLMAQLLIKNLTFDQKSQNRCTTGTRRLSSLREHTQLLTFWVGAPKIDEFLVKLIVWTLDI